jgi:uncharacterized iron-regulated protein
MDELKQDLHNKLGAVTDEITYYEFLNSVAKTENHADAYRQKLKGFIDRATKRIDGVDCTGSSLVAVVAEVQATRKLASALLNDLDTQKERLEALKQRRAEIATALRDLEYPAQRARGTKAKLTPPKES